MKIFDHLVFELTNHLFQQNLMPSLVFTRQWRDRLWRNVSVNVFANSIWSSLLISVTKVYWRVQPTAARRSGRFNQTHGALRALRIMLGSDAGSYF